MRITTGTMRARLPWSCRMAVARGPLEVCGRRPYCAHAGSARLNRPQMTAAAPLRYKWRIGDDNMEKGDKAPEFSLPDQNGKVVSLKELRGKTVVLFFFPKADTPG